MQIKLRYPQITLILFLFVLFNNSVPAHCDTMDGPVVKASQKALETGNINYVLIWVKAGDENQIKDIFQKVLKVRTLNNDAKELADNYFFETVVRLHRMGEGEPYTGIKPSGYKPGKGIEAADLAVEKNSIEPVLSIIDEKYLAAAKDMFADLQSKKNYDIDDVKAGREYVTSYIHFIHYIAEASGEVSE